jgi:hypothetical protein
MNFFNSSFTDVLVILYQSIIGGWYQSTRDYWPFPSLWNTFYCLHSIGKHGWIRFTPISKMEDRNWPSYVECAYTLKVLVCVSHGTRIAVLFNLVRCSLFTCYQFYFLFLETNSSPRKGLVLSKCIH